MKTFNSLIVILIILSFHTSCYGKSNKSFWLPEKYIASLGNQDTVQNSIYLLPIASFCDPFDKCEVLTFQSEFRHLKTERFIHNDTIKYKVIDLENHVNVVATPPPNSDYNDKVLPLQQLVDELKASTIIYYKEGERLLLIISSAISEKKIYFVNTVNGKKITSYDQVKSLIEY